MSLDNTHFGAEQIAKFLDGKKNLFFVGIGGVSMCSLARISQLRGYNVSGYDRSKTDTTVELENYGIKVFYEEDASHVENCDILIYTVAISENNPEYSTAKSKGIPCISRADYLGYLMSSYKCRIGICGMHGKSTTTSMTEALFSTAGLNPTVNCGANMRHAGSSHVIGENDYFIFEACEYKDSFLDFYPSIAIVLNIEMDHVDYFHSMEQIRESFNKFMCRTNNGIALVNSCDDDVMKATEGFEGTVVTFGIEDKNADYYADNIKISKGKGNFDIFHDGKFLCHLSLNVPGSYCILDALASSAAAHICGISPEMITKGISEFRGTSRRLEECGKTKNGADIFSDYAHHPTEITATLITAADMGYDNVYCVFQPHTYSRTSELFDNFAKSLSENITEAIIAPIYSARETNSYGVSSEALCDKIKSFYGNARFIAQFEDIATYLQETAKPEDMVLIMGAGDITKVIKYLKEEN